MDSSVFEYFDIFLLVLARMGGLVFINPVFSRRGVPPMVRTGLVLALSLPESEAEPDRSWLLVPLTWWSPL